MRLIQTIRDFGIWTKIPIRLILANYVAKILTGRNRRCWYPVHYSSTVVFGHKLELSGSKRGTFASLALSGGCYLQAGHGIVIGEGTIWAPNVVIVSANHDMQKADKSWSDEATPVTIGRNCWIGAGATILPGVILGDNTIVGAGAVVTKPFPTGNEILIGNPARPLQSSEEC